MSKVLIFLTFFCLCLIQIQAQQNENKRICQRLSRSCNACQRTGDTNDDVTKLFNDNCRRNNRQWRNVSRCELNTATCELTLVSCRPVTCANVRRVLREL